ncbi:hypothetical protein CGZ94_16665 [Enemella evansiae]|uniref:Uncharacterized protein n=1 Tax=Enemella evansiae TaxID=2016499 RepID=A0A255G3Z1_9ACTN|nr:hypothetical protein CGZ94_16665 [Enemella evansiae]OYO15534.1 hypothetical protein CGZ98_03760 [Enemella evansiae]OYO20529.1 hypothetical protein BI335_03095 [Enemella evansiae]
MPFSSAGAVCSAGARRLGTSSTARSRFGSNWITVAGNRAPVPPTCRVIRSAPAITWALVTTRRGCATQPEPSATRLQPGIEARIFTTLAAARWMPGVVTAPSSGAAASIRGSSSGLPKTGGKPAS